LLLADSAESKTGTREYLQCNVVRRLGTLRLVC
jgi:hypothetical protein